MNIGQLDAVEFSQSDVNAAAKKFRIATFKRFRQDEFIYRERMRVAAGVLQTWNDGEVSMSDQNLVHWFEEAEQGRLKRLPVTEPDLFADLPSKTLKPVAIQTDTLHAKVEREQNSFASAPLLPHERITRTPQITFVNWNRSTELAPVAAAPIDANLVTRRDDDDRKRALTRSQSNDQPVLDIDTSVLIALIESLNLRINDIELRLTENERINVDLDVDELQFLVREIDTVLVQREMASTYVDLLNEKQRSLVPKIASVQSTAQKAGRQIFQMHLRIAEEHTIENQDRMVLNQLRELSERVKSWQK